MGKKKVVTTEIIEEQGRSGQLEEVNGETGQEEQTEIDPIEELKLSGCQRFTLHRIEGMTGREIYVAGFRQEELSWQGLTRFGSGEYNIKGLYSSGEIAINRVVKIDTTVHDVTRIAESSMGQAIIPNSGGKEEHATVALMNIVQQVVAKALQDRNVAPANPMMPDMGRFMESMGQAMAAGISGAMGTVTTIIQKTMEMNLESRDPKNIIGNMKDVLELADMVKGGGRISQEGMIEGLLKKAIEFFGPIVATNMMSKMTPPNTTLSAPPDPAWKSPVTPIPEPPKVESAPQPNPPAQMEKPTFEQLLFHFSSALIAKTSIYHPGLGAELFFAELPTGYVDSLRKWLEHEPLSTLFILAPHTKEKERWFEAFIENLIDELEEYDRQIREGSENEPESIISEARGRKNDPTKIN